MDPFFLQLPAVQQDSSINYSSKLFLMGSCFVENIGEKLEYHKFRNKINPFGIVFHPVAIRNLLKRIAEQHFFTENDLVFHNERWHCFEVHSSLSNPNKENFISDLNNQLKTSFEFLKEATHVILTFGTAWGYVYKKNNLLVANCHKIPQQQFNKQISSVIDLEKCFDNCFKLIQKVNAKAQIIATISPVRHIKDGIIENNRSKANLTAALHQIITTNNKITYYPAYEIVIDCLRDYRFYKRDLVHPNDTAIDFIWEHFCQSWIYDILTQKTLKRVSEIQRGLQHKPFNAESEAHKKFISSLDRKISDLNKKYPFIEF